MNKTLNLRAATPADDIRCYDGELENADFIFNNRPDGEDSSEQSEFFTTVASLSVSLPKGASFLGMHPLGDGYANAILALEGAEIAYLKIFEGNNSGEGKDMPEVTLKPRRIVEGLTPSKVAASGDWLVFLGEESLEFARWNGAGYDWLGKAPVPPAASFIHVSKPLPPYSYSGEDFPELNIQVPLGNDSEKDVLDWLAGKGFSCSAATRRNILSEIKTAFMSFLADVKGAGLFYSPVKAAACWVFPGDILFGMSAPVVLGPSGKVAFRISAASCSDSMLYFTLVLNRAPFKIAGEWKDASFPEGALGVRVLSSFAYDFIADAVSDPVWLDSTSRGFTLGERSISDDDFSAFPNVSRHMEEFGKAEDIFSIDGRLFVVSSGRLYLNVSHSTIPFISSLASPYVSTTPVVHVGGSLRPAASAPLYAFCTDGVRALSLVGSALKQVQKISRDVALGENHFAPASDSTFFITSAGIKSIKGTSLTVHPVPLSGYDTSSRIIYLYEENSLLLYRDGEADLQIYDIGKRKWFEGYGVIEGFHYSWPRAYIVSEGRLQRLGLRKEARASVYALADRIIPVTTRPVKLGSAFTIKKLEEVSAIWPDGSVHPVRVYGATSPGKWFFLGMTRQGRMLMRGSGWRFFKFETFCISSSSGYLLPQIFIKFAT